MNQLKAIADADKMDHWLFALILPRTQSVQRCSPKVKYNSYVSYIRKNTGNSTGCSSLKAPG
jgi:hypothetical protein